MVKNKPYKIVMLLLTLIMTIFGFFVFLDTPHGNWFLKRFFLIIEFLSQAQINWLIMLLIGIHIIWTTLLVRKIYTKEFNWKLQVKEFLYLVLTAFIIGHFIGSVR